MPQLRKELAISQVTLERAYEALEARGLIERRRRRGVFVADRLGSGEFAAVVKPELLGAAATPYYRTVSAHLVRLLQEHNPRWQVRMHIGLHGKSDEQFPATLDLLEESVLPRLRGVFSFHRLFDLDQKLTDAKVPLVYLGNERGPRSVVQDGADAFRGALTHLKESGCRTVGLIGHSFPVGSDFVGLFRKEAQARGLEWRAQWIEQIPPEESVGERTGYESFMRLWQRTPRPDGLLVQDDVMCNGMLRGTLQLGVKMPAELKLIALAVRGIELAYHQPVTRVEFDMEELAQQAVAMMLSLVRGEAPPRQPVLLKSRLVLGQTT